jgi:hypothetical protein
LASSAWEMNIVTSGVAAWVVIDGNGNHESFEQHVGEIVFAPQGSFDYFENRGPADLSITIIQNTSAPEAKDNVGMGESQQASTAGVVRRLRRSRRDVQFLQKDRQRDRHPAVAVAALSGETGPAAHLVERLEMRTGAGPSSALQCAPRAGPYTVASHVSYANDRGDSGRLVQFEHP